MCARKLASALLMIRLMLGPMRDLDTQLAHCVHWQEMMLCVSMAGWASKAIQLLGTYGIHIHMVETTITNQREQSL